MFVGISCVAVLGTVVLLAVNAVARGGMLNYGTDFKGGSEIHVDFSRDVAPAKIRSALEAGGFRGAEVMSMKDPKRAHMYLVRLTEVAAFSPAQLDKARVELGKLDAKLRKFDHPAEGDKVFVSFEKSAEASAIVQGFAQAGVAARDVQTFGRPEDHTYQVTLGELEAELRRIFDSKLGAGAVKEIPQIESVGAKVGKQLRNDGAKSALYTLILILLYVWFRFDVGMAFGGVIALAHDVLLTAGLFALLWREFTLQIVAALLTIAGYSINDTIVVFDRVRENMVRLRDRRLPALVNASVNETLSRTTLTSLATFFTTAAIFYFTRGSVRDFGLAMSFGVIVGSYSTIFVAAPVFLWITERLNRKSRV